MSSKNLMLGLALKYPFRIVANVILGFSGALFNGVSTALIVPILLSLMGQGNLLEGGPPILRHLLAPFQQLPEQHRLLAMAGAVIFVIILKNMTTYVGSLATSSLSRAITAELQERGLRLLLDVDLDFFAKAKAGDLMNRLSGEMSRTTTSVTAWINLVTVMITILVFVGLLLSISWQLTIVATVLMPISLLINRQLVSRSKRYGKMITGISQEYSGHLVELFSGIRLVKATGNENQEYNYLQSLIRQREKTDFQAKMNSAAVSPIGEVVNITILFALVLIGRSIFSQELEALSAILLTYLVLLSRLLPFVSQLNSIRESLARSAASVEIVNDLLRRDNKSFMKNGSVGLTPLRQGIHFKDLGFSYPDTQEIVLQDINLFIPKGTTLALVGSSGAGKSTLADLLPRFYDPTEGCITLDGIDLQEYDLKQLRSRMGIVSQDTFLFNDTIRNNIAYGFPKATNEEILSAIRRANAHEFIMRLPQGLDTMIGDRGVMLSGGQRQRLAIARALLKDPDILILDEATSALDTVSERLVQQALDELSRERTTLVIAHRLSTVRKADQIAVMERGRVVELGTHEELLRRNGAYSRLHAMQFAETPQSVATKEEKHELLAQTSYEFRTRLNAMLGSLDLLSNGLIDDPSEQSELVEESYRSAVELFRIVRQLESASNPSQPSPIPPEKVAG